MENLMGNVSNMSNKDICKINVALGSATMDLVSFSFSPQHVHESTPKNQSTRVCFLSNMKKNICFKENKAFVKEILYIVLFLIIKF